MENKLLHTPEGVRDIYERECAGKLAIQDKIHKQFHLYGYRDIQTPTFEFFDIFSKERGSVGTKEMFKFFDRDNNTLVLRPDMTPSIARCVAKYYLDETMPIRLCYLESAFINNTSYQGRLKESTQTGVELIGDDSSDADAEMIALVIASLKASGLEEFQVELGQVDFFRGLLEEAGMEEEVQEQLRELIENKNFFGVEGLLSTLRIDESLKQAFLKLPQFFGPIEQIRQARTMTANPRALHAIDRLEKVQEILDIYGLGDYISYDLGMLSKYSYYTGIIFKAYTYGTGDYIVTGGRYDKLLVQFGKDASAIGFAIEVDKLLQALSRQKIEIPVDMVKTMILYQKSARAGAICLADHFRNQGMAVQMVRTDPERDIDDYLEFAGRSHIRNVLIMSEDGREMQIMDLVQNHISQLALTDYVESVESQEGI